MGRSQSRRSDGVNCESGKSTMKGRSGRSIRSDGTKLAGGQRALGGRIVQPFGEETGGLDDGRMKNRATKLQQSPIEG